MLLVSNEHRYRDKELLEILLFCRGHFCHLDLEFKTQAAFFVKLPKLTYTILLSPFSSPRPRCFLASLRYNDFTLKR